MIQSVRDWMKKWGDLNVFFDEEIVSGKFVVVSVAVAAVVGEQRDELMLVFEEFDWNLSVLQRWFVLETILVLKVAVANDEMKEGEDWMRIVVEGIRS